MARKTDWGWQAYLLRSMQRFKVAQLFGSRGKLLPFFFWVCLFLFPAIPVQGHILSQDRALFDSISHRILTDLVEKQSRNVVQLDGEIREQLLQIEETGACLGVNYQSTHRTHWEPLKHLDAMLLLAFGYIHTESSYFKNKQLEATLLRMIAYWLEQAPRSSNWYQNHIAEPQRMGQLLLLLQVYGDRSVPPPLLQAATNRMKEKGGTPQAQKGANRVDVALHWVYRACLLNDEALLQEAFNQIYSTLTYTEQAEGIQYDHSFTQHGRQLHIGSYGDVFLSGVVTACFYAVETPYQLPGHQLQILSALITKAYLPAIRGKYISYNVIGRSSTRPNATSREFQATLFEKMCSLDRANESLYRDAMQRLKGTKPASYGIGAYSHHFFCSDYTLHQRPSYLVDVRTLSIRTARNEYLKDNGEGIKQYFMSYGAMGIYVNGDEYSNIFPAWDYNLIPGVTAPYMKEIPRATTYIKRGENQLAGGVSNGLYSIAAYQMEDYDTLYQVNSKGNKGWFLFDKEVVCLGNGISSQSDYPVYTTLNQTLLKDDVIVSQAGKQKQISLTDSLQTMHLDWAYHSGIGYYFKEKTKAILSVKEREGAWSDINTNFSSDTIRKELFTLAIDHGTSPQMEAYSYILLPGINSSQEVESYDVSSIEILENSQQAMIVWNKSLQLVGAIFYQPIQSYFAGIHFECNKSCVVLFEKVGSKEVTLHVADPTRQEESIELKVQTQRERRKRSVIYAPQICCKGSTFTYRLEDMPKLNESYQ